MEKQMPINGTLCRACINTLYGTQLTRSQCYYFIYPQPCANCGQLSNTVMKLSLLGKIKLFFAQLHR